MRYTQGMVQNLRTAGYRHVSSIDKPLGSVVYLRGASAYYFIGFDLLDWYGNIVGFLGLDQIINGGQDNESMIIYHMADIGYKFWYNTNNEVHMEPCLMYEGRLVPMCWSNYPARVLTQSDSVAQYYLNTWQSLTSVIWGAYSYEMQTRDGSAADIEVMSYDTIDEGLRAGMRINCDSNLKLSVDVQVYHKEVMKPNEPEVKVAEDRQADEPAEEKSVPIVVQIQEQVVKAIRGDDVGAEEKLEEELFEEDVSVGVEACSFENMNKNDKPKFIKPEVITRPIPFTEIDIDAGLFIPRDTKIEPALPFILMNSICYAVGVPMSRTLLKDTLNHFESRYISIHNDKLKPFFGVDSIDFSGRKWSPTHIAVLYSKAFSKLVNGNVHVKNGNVSLTEPHLRAYHNKAKNINNNKNWEDFGVDHMTAINFERITEAVLEYKECLAAASQFKSYRPVISGTYCRSADQRGKDGLWATPDVNDEDIVWVHPEIGFTETFRMTTSSPNIQGMNTLLKSCIKAPKGYSIFSLDISAQDVYPLICELFEDKEIMYLTEKLHDPYFATLEKLGYAPTAENKAACKVPFLSTLNGKSWNTIDAEIKETDLPYDIVKNIYNYIRHEPGYKKMYEESYEEAKKAVSYRTGLFGLSKAINKAGIKGSDRRPLTGQALVAAVQRRILNGNFQITSSELFMLGYNTLVYDLMNGKIDGINLRNLCPLVGIYDELVGIAENSLLERHERKDGTNYVMDLISYYMLPRVEGWVRMFGKPRVSDRYTH